MNPLMGASASSPWLAMLAGSAGCAVGLLCLVALSGRVSRAWRYACLLAFSLTGLAGACGLLDRPLLLWLPALGIAGGALVIQACSFLDLSGAVLGCIQLLRSPRAQLVSLLTVAPLALSALLLPPSRSDVPIHSSAQLLADTSVPNPSVIRLFQAQTDRGSPIFLALASPNIAAPDLKAIADRFIRDNGPENTLVNVSPADCACNCHGWIFGAGRFWIMGEEVETILQENGYGEVMVPRVDDLIVYRGERGQITHTALVRTVTTDGLILLESKWGQMGRYIHKPEDPRFPSTFTYHRSSRKGHRLKGLDNPTPVITRTLPPIL